MCVPTCVPCVAAATSYDSCVVVCRCGETLVGNWLIGLGQKRLTGSARLGGFEAPCPTPGRRIHDRDPTYRPDDVVAARHKPTPTQTRTCKAAGTRFWTLRKKHKSGSDQKKKRRSRSSSNKNLESCLRSVGLPNAESFLWTDANVLVPHLRSWVKPNFPMEHVRSTCTY